MTLNQVQINFINQSARPAMEALVRGAHDLEVFITSYQAIQASANKLPEDDTVLFDNAAGDGPREDAPVLVGAHIRALNDIATGMLANVTPEQRLLLVSLMVRTLAIVLGRNND